VGLESALATRRGSAARGGTHCRRATGRTGSAPAVGRGPPRRSRAPGRAAMRSAHVRSGAAAGRRERSSRHPASTNSTRTRGFPVLLTGPRCCCSPLLRSLGAQPEIGPRRTDRRETARDSPRGAAIETHWALPPLRSSRHPEPSRAGLFGGHHVRKWLPVKHRRPQARGAMPAYARRNACKMPVRSSAPTL